MQKTIYILLFLFITLNGYAQDFQPGQQAENLAKYKNVMVDYSTGLFHYTIPVYKLNVGNYKLPILLNYVSKGVKLNDEPGLVGYNWTLNTGGIVTRTVRGGIADEDKDCGYLWTSNGSIPLKEDCKNVSLRNRDGESDIFTAVFNGKKVDFIIRADAKYRIYAEPLECTNVHIECENSGNFIEGWKIIDEEGNRYFYRQQEWSVNVCRSNVSTANSVANSSYISSWHLTKIIPCNSAPIEFIYKRDVGINNSGQENKINKTHIWDSYTMKYTYGRPVMEFPFNFNKYQGDFQKDIQEARSYLDGYSWELRTIEAKTEALCQFVGCSSQPFGASLEKALSENFRVMGILSEIKGATVASEELINALHSLKRTCEQSGSSKLGMAAIFLGNAASKVESCMREMRNISNKEVSGGIDYDVYSPMLAMIVTPDQIIEFGYKNEEESNLLTSITLCDWFKEPISSVSLTYQEANNKPSFLNKVSFLDKDDMEISNIQFDYYDYSFFQSVDNMYLEADLWGYCQAKSTTGGSVQSGKLFATLNSLKSVVLSDGGKIEINYEKNEFYKYSLDFVSDYGGIRLKSLVFADEVSNSIDSIFYDYPLAGRSVYNESTNLEIIHYPGFSDVITSDRIRNEGHPFLNFGNNGIFYPYVIETIRGKGTNTYLYQVPNSTEQNGVYAFWLNGLLLGKAVYDEQGRLQQIAKYRYSTALDECSAVYCQENLDYFVNDLRSPYNRCLPQIQASDYYLDGESLQSFYKKQSTDYAKGEDLYNANIEPRLSPILPQMSYDLYYGGKTVLKEELIYRFEGGQTGRISYNDFFMSLVDSPFCKIEYYYDNIHSVFPTRIDEIGSDGNVHTMIRKRVIDICDGVDPTIDKMKKRNLLSPVIKQLNLFNGQVSSETVWRYQADQQLDTCFLAPFEQLVYIPEGKLVYSGNTTDTSLFTYGESNYDTMSSYKYVRNKVSYLPMEENAWSKKKSYAYDTYGHLLLDCSSVCASASDKYKYFNSLNNKFEIARAVKSIYGQLQQFYNIYERIDINIIDDREFLDYYNNGSNRLIIQFIKMNLQASISPDLDLIMELQTEITADNNRLLNEFEQRYTAFAQSYPQYRGLLVIMYPLRHILTSEIYVNNPFAKYVYQVNYITDSPYGVDYSIRLTTIPDSKRLKLYVLDGSRSISCQVSHAGGRTSYIPSECNSSSMLKVFDLDLSAYEDITAVDIPSSGVYMALVPEGSSFKATSYNFDGTIYARFDETMNLELYSYDSAGRVVQTKDQYGNILKEYKYNQVINE